MGKHVAVGREARLLGMLQRLPSLSDQSLRPCPARHCAVVDLGQAKFVKGDARQRAACPLRSSSGVLGVVQSAAGDIAAALGLGPQTSSFI